MKLRNAFSPQTRALFIYNYSCFWCGENGCDAGHHILGRVSTSPLNFCPIHNHRCHIGNSALDSFENRAMLLHKTLKYLLSEGYRLTNEDKEFKEKYKNYYDYD